ncbi:MAG: hypothetical protein ACKV19_10905 [Verrucomicrobiales bacterium]
MVIDDLAVVEIVPVALVDGRVVAASPGKSWWKLIEAGKIVIFRGALAPGRMVGLRRALLGWGAVADPIPPGVSASRPGLDFHRVDDGTEPTTMPHIFHQFGFATGASLPAPLAAEVRALRHLLLDWQNQLAGTHFDLDDAEFRFKAMRHPRGGGHLVSHRHPFLPQKVAVFLNLSEPSRDYASGAAVFRNASGWVDTFADFRCGDLLAWRYDLVHAISRVGPESRLTWDGDDGLWIAAMERFEAHPHSKVA